MESISRNYICENDHLCKKCTKIWKKVSSLLHTKYVLVLAVVFFFTTDPSFNFISLVEAEISRTSLDLYPFSQTNMYLKKLYLLRINYYSKHYSNHFKPFKLFFKPFVRFEHGLVIFKCFAPSGKR